MKLRRARIQNFKGVKDCTIDFEVAGRPEPRRFTALVGDNGSGKTTVLQAIALTISLATRRTRAPEALRWHGFLADRVATLGPTSVELDVLFDARELATLNDAYASWRALRPDSQGIVAPSALSHVKLLLTPELRSRGPDLAAFNQFQGRSFIKQLVATQPAWRGRFAELGDVFWFDQFRNLGSGAIDAAAENGEHGPAEGWQAGVEVLRDRLVKWWGFHRSDPPPPRDRDFLAQLEEHMSRVFPGTTLAGTEPRDSTRAPDFFFLFERDGRRFDLAELSSGEQAVFSLLNDFVQLNIARSIVLIDELELHLHPPAQQALLAALKRLGPDCQFIFTTHSEHLRDVLPAEEVVVLEGGRRCL